MGRALANTRASNFGLWYREVLRRADLAEQSAVRGCMVIKPAGYGIWELMQQGLDRRFKATGHENCYFPLFIPLSFISKEAEHVEGFAKEMAVVTHHRLRMIDGNLVPDPESKLSEPLIVRPTSETIIADSFKKWIKTHRDLPLLLNQWANVVRWEMRPRPFLRTTEFLWQEGHTAHVDRDDAFAETMRMLGVYREFAETVVAMPVIAGEKTANERFPGADNSFTIEAMMQDGKALQAGTSHYLGTHFSTAQEIKFKPKTGPEEFVHTTSWGSSTRLIGGLIMTHGDDDGLRLPPALAPKQIVLVLRRRGDSTLTTYAESLASQLRERRVFGEPVRVHVDHKSPNSARWDWVRRGIPIIVEIGPREEQTAQVSFVRRDRLRDGETDRKEGLSLSACVEQFPAILEEIQSLMFEEARKKRDALIVSGIGTFSELADYFGRSTDDEEEGDDPSPDEAPDGAGASTDAVPSSEIKGWVRASWCRPTGAELEEVAGKLRDLKLSIRCAPLEQPSVHGKCVFSGKPGVEEILIGRSY